MALCLAFVTCKEAKASAATSGAKDVIFYGYAFLSSMSIKKSLFHPHNRHQGQYDFDRLCQHSPTLLPFIHVDDQQQHRIDFADPLAVKALNAAILKADYGIDGWDIPAGQLCPPIPGRADYIHYLADVLRQSHQGKLPKKQHLTVLDIGTGASGIYPLLGVAEYGWRFVAADINPTSLEIVEHILARNNTYARQISLRLQPHANAIFDGVINDDDWFDLTMCNPPFHGSLAEAQEGTRRKWTNLNKEAHAESAAPVLNFGGQDAELWCPGGELAFIERMIKESARYASRCFWFTCLVSKSANLPVLKTRLKNIGVQDQREIAMAQGNKQSRFLAWTFLTPTQQAGWRKLRW